ncbi:MAG: flagellar protein FlgN [Ruminiclostridium sp.]|nr:flagellar protein FlgN [Ruminiclostridium sp.]
MINQVWIDNLIKVLEYENKLYGQLYSIAENKTGLVVKSEVDSLQELVGKEQKLISELNKLQDVREQIIGQVAQTIGKDPREVTISQLAAYLPQDQAKKLTCSRVKLKETVRKLTDKNDLNQQLIKNALEYVDFSLNLLTQPAPQTPQYGRKGNETGAKGRGILDIKY